MWLALSLLACGSSFSDPGCLHRELDDWCLHDEALDGPSGDGACAPPADPTFGHRCGDYDVDFAGGGFTSTTWYYDHETGELAAVMFGTDVNTYCGGFHYWYGRRIRCEDLCSYAPDDETLPLCDG